MYDISRDFYMAASNKACSSQVKGAFQMLASTEYEHMQRLYEHAIGLPGEGALLPLDRLERELKV